MLSSVILKDFPAFLSHLQTEPREISHIHLFYFTIFKATKVILRYFVIVQSFENFVLILSGLEIEFEMDIIKGQLLNLYS